MKAFVYVMSACAVLVVAACGGGGGGSTAAPAASVPLTTANYDPTGRASAATLVDVQSSSSVDSLTAYSGTDAPVQTSLGVLQVARLMASLASATVDGRVAPAASQTRNQSCTYGGSLSATGIDANDNQRLDAGDSFTANFSGCVLESGHPALSGGLDFTVKSATYSGTTLTGLTLSATFRSLASGGSTLNGAADISVSDSSGSVAYHDASSVRGGKTTVYNFTATTAIAAQTTLAVAGQISISGAAYTLSTPTTIVMGNVYPASGLLRVADAAGGRVDVVIRPSDFDVDLYLPGDAVRDAHATYTWAALASGSI